MDIATRMLEHDCWLVAQLLQHCQDLTDDQLDRPITLSVESVDDDMTVRSCWPNSSPQGEVDRRGAGGEQAPTGTTRASPAYAGASPRPDRRSCRWLTRQILDRGEEGADVHRCDAVSRRVPSPTAGCQPRPELLRFPAHGGLLALREMGVTDLGMGDPMGYPES